MLPPALMILQSLHLPALFYFLLKKLVFHQTKQNKSTFLIQKETVNKQIYPDLQLFYCLSYYSFLIKIPQFLDPQYFQKNYS